MGEREWTPGPWEVRETGCFMEAMVYDGEGRPVAHLKSAFGEADENGIMRALSHNGVFANARLIAAAPEMAELLEEISSPNAMREKFTTDWWERRTALLSRIKGTESKSC